MKRFLVSPLHTKVYAAILTVAASGVTFAQDAQDALPPPGPPAQQNPAPAGRWRRMGDPIPGQSVDAANPGPAYPDPQGPGGPDGAPDDRRNYPPPPQNYAPPPPVPARLNLAAGTYITVRVNQTLSSDHNQAGDAFMATIVQPVVVDGVVIAQRGQTIGGRVAEAQKAGRVEGVSKLAVQLTDLTLVDGQQVPIQSQLVSRSGPTSEGRDAAGIIGTTAAGAAIGAGVNGGVGAGVGAGIGGIVGTIGVLLTRGRPTVIYPESVLTFRVEAPVTIATDRAPQAFRYVGPNDYERPYDMRAEQGRPQYGAYGGAPYGAYPPPPYYGPAYYPYYPYWGPSVAFYWGGPRFYGRGYYRGGYRGFRR